MNRRRGSLRGDDGASLIFALIIITTVALVTVSLLQQADTSVRATVALRGEALSAYDADAAGQAAVNALRKGIFNNMTASSCFGAAGTLPLSNFYPATNGQPAASAAVTCTAESGTGAQGTPVPITNANKPGQAILTLGTSTLEDGQAYGQSNKAITIHGSITSDSNINSSSATLAVSGNGTSIHAHTTCAGSFGTPACVPSSASIPDPNYPAPTAPPAPPVAPTCNNNKVEVLSPGLYTDVSVLTACTKATWLYLKPGTYYFDFTNSGSHVWSITGTVIGGTLSVSPGSPPDTAPAIPGACVSPLTTTTAVGVQLVFGGDSQLSFGSSSANAEFCATYSASSIPTVVYGLKADVVNGTNTVHAESGCVIAINGCNLISIPGNGVKPTFFFEGFAYAPRAAISLPVNNTSQPFFNFGLISRTLTLTTTGSTNCVAPCSIISLPDNSPGYGTAATIVDLSVYICPGASTCAPGGAVKLTARVEINDPTGSPVAGARQMTVLSWSQQH